MSIVMNKLLPCPLGGVLCGHNHVQTFRYRPTTNSMKKISEKITFNLSKKIFSILALLVESPIYMYQVGNTNTNILVNFVLLLNVLYHCLLLWLKVLCLHNCLEEYRYLAPVVLLVCFSFHHQFGMFPFCLPSVGSFSHSSYFPITSSICLPHAMQSTRKALQSSYKFDYPVVQRITNLHTWHDGFSLLNSQVSASHACFLTTFIFWPTAAVARFVSTGYFNRRAFKRFLSSSVKFLSRAFLKSYIGLCNELFLFYDVFCNSISRILTP